VPESEILRMQGEAKKMGKLVGYERLSSELQKDDLNRQIEILNSRRIKVEDILHFGVEVEVINENIYQSPQEELVKDLITLVAHFSGKLYGVKSHRQKEVIDNVKNIFS
jgi:predicted site-specific integrase-resolvase